MNEQLQAVAFVEADAATLYAEIVTLKAKLAAAQGREEGKQLIIAQLELSLISARVDALEEAAVACVAVQDKKWTDEVYECQRRIRALKHKKS